MNYVNKISSSFAFRVSAGCGFLAVVLGAFGAHGLKNILVEQGTGYIWETAAFYHLVHSVVLILLASRTQFHRWTWIFFIGGVFIFSGSLYLLAVTGVKVLGAITPVGGLALLLGWLLLVVNPLVKKSEEV